MQLVNKLELTLLLRHCNDNLGAGVSCIGVASSGAPCASHVAFHTWPDGTWNELRWRSLDPIGFVLSHS
ncbi:hypothetical protein ACHAWF_000519 [Thalassiosira exigua]